MAYYEEAFLQYPQDQATISFILRYVLDHVTYDNQQTYCELWRSHFNARLMQQERVALRSSQLPLL